MIFEETWHTGVTSQEVDKNIIKSGSSLLSWYYAEEYSYLGGFANNWAAKTWQIGPICTIIPVKWMLVLLKCNGLKKSIFLVPYLQVHSKWLASGTFVRINGHLGQTLSISQPLFWALHFNNVSAEALFFVTIWFNWPTLIDVINSLSLSNPFH